MAGRDRFGRDVRLELEHHVAASTEYLIEQGLPPERARAEAIRRLGSFEDAERRLYPYAREREVRMRLRDWVQSWLEDLRYAGRTLGRERGFAAVMALTLALAIGVNGAMFGVVDRLLLRGPTHVQEPDRVLRVYYTGGPPGSAPRTFSSNGYAAYAGLVERTSSFEALAAYTRASEHNLGEGLDVERVLAQGATWTLFPLLGVTPELGRFFGEADDTPPVGAPVAVISHGLWMRRYGGRESSIGQRLVLDGRPYTIVGVAPRGFTGAELGRVDVWFPVSSAGQPRTDWATTWAAKWLHAIGRLRPGVSPEAAAADATAAYRQAYDGPVAFEREHALSLRPLRYDPIGVEPMEATVAKWVAGVAVIVLLVACANVANMLLARLLRRRRELAVRAALGITRGRLARLLAAEVLLLAAAGAALALGVAWWIGRVVRAALLSDVVWDGAPIDTRLLGFTVAATLVTASLVSLTPIVQAARIRLTDSLRDGAPQGGLQRAHVRRLLAVAQASLSVVLLIGAGLFVQSLARVQALDLGIETDRVVAVSLQWRPLAALTAEQQEAERVRRGSVTAWTLPRLRALPGVEAVSASIGLPFQSAFGLGVRAPGVEPLPDLPGGGPYVSAVGTDYFGTVGTDLVLGRVFTEADPGAGAERVAIVNDTTARVLWPGAPALGQCLVIGSASSPCSRVVGVVEDTRRFSLQEDPAMQIYAPIGQVPVISGITLLVRRSAGTDFDGQSIRRALFAVDPTLHYVNVTPLQDRVDPQVRPWRLGAATFAGMGVLAFVIAAIGLYGVIACNTAQRTHEMGVRLALGARAADVIRLVVGGGMATAAAGVAIGVALALLAGPLIEPVLFQTSPRNPAVFAGVIVVLLASACVASLLPARRASRVDPAVTLRA